MTLLAALILLTVVPAGQDPATPGRRSVDQLISDLGAPDPGVRDRAEQELRKMGSEAVPALREASRSGNAERAMKARALLLDVAGDQRAKEGKDAPSKIRPPAPRMVVVVDDWTQGIHFTLRPDGAVQLRVPERDESTGRREYRTYRADSIEEFKKKHPEVAKKHDLEKFLRMPEVRFEDEKLREWLGLRDFDSRWLSEGDDKGSEDRRGRRFGILLSPMDPALASQLGLAKGEGVLVRRVEPESLAEKSGVKPYDVIVRIDGEKVGARRIEEFRNSLRKALGAKEFTVDLIRKGTLETIHVKPPVEDEKSEVK